MRQYSEDDIITRFRVALSELRVSNLSVASWELLNTRVQNRLSSAEVSTFSKALRLYFTNAEVNETNFDKLSHLDQPVKVLQANH